jgi:hypothetical protein
VQFVNSLCCVLNLSSLCHLWTLFFLRAATHLRISKNPVLADRSFCRMSFYPAAEPVCQSGQRWTPSPLSLWERSARRAG